MPGTRSEVEEPPGTGRAGVHRGGNSGNSRTLRGHAATPHAQNGRMDDQQRAELAGLLEARRRELTDATERLRTGLSTPAEGGWPEVRDSVEDGDARMMATMDVTSLRRQEDELREVVQALDRLRTGGYGRCETCDQEIPYARLQVRPEARFCIRHEEAWEHAHPGGAQAQS